MLNMCLERVSIQERQLDISSDVSRLEMERRSSAAKCQFVARKIGRHPPKLHI